MMSVENTNYAQRYYDTHKDELAEKRRLKYEKDGEYRKACLERAKEYYRQNRDEIRAKSRRVPMAVWKVGREEPVYQISALCEALGVKPITVRLWIRENKIPETPLKRNQIRYYTQEMIDVVVDAIPDTFRKDWGEIYSKISKGWRGLGVMVKTVKVISK